LTCLLNSRRSDDCFVTFWEAVVSEAANLGIEPMVPRIRRISRRIDDGSSQHLDQTVEDFHRRLYFSSLDAATTCLSTRFQHSAFSLARNVETVFLEVINSGTVPPLHDILAHYGDDIDEAQLSLHLSMVADLCRPFSKPTSHCYRHQWRSALLFKDNEVWSQMFPQVVKLLRLYLYYI